MSEGQGIPPRKALVGAVALVVTTALLTYAAMTVGYQLRYAGLLKRPDRVELATELARSEAFDRFLTVLALIERNYVQRPDLDQLIQGATEGAVAALHDPYSAFFTPVQFERFSIETSGAYEGIGVQVTDEGKYVVVVNPFPGTPGATAPFLGAGPNDPRGLRPQDRIVAVDGRNVVGVPSEQVVNLIRGSPGTEVELTVLRTVNGEEKTLTFRIRRARIRVPTTTARFLGGGIGYLHVTQFTAATPDQIRSELERLRAEGTRGLVLDLRYNPGGMLDKSVEAAGFFVPKGPVVHVVDRDGRRQTYSTEGPGLGMPLAVLVNRATASAAEILAGAIQDSGAGVLVGERTFGKGLVQQVFTFKDGTGLKLTILKYLTPKGRDLNRRRDPETGREEGGLEPDVPVVFPEGAVFGDPARDPQLARAVQVVREALR
ncbi:MAG: S41 family peptidase [Clostridia bacterium]|nr:S41 family peptidase [Clostridia bacterium]